MPEISSFGSAPYLPTINSIHLYGLQNTWLLPLSAQDIRHSLTQMLSAAFAILPEHSPFEIELLMVRDGEMIVCNHEAMDCPGPTNILSFPASTDNHTDFCADSCFPLPVASLVLSVDAVRRESRLFYQAPEKHLLRLLAHGIGHLMGFQHSHKMFVFCDNILKLHK